MRYLAADLGPQGIRVNALSAGPMRTLAGAGVSDARVHLQLPARPRARCGARRRSTRWAAPALYLLSDLSGAVTGEVHFVDCGYNTVAMPSLECAEGAGAGALPLPASSPPQAAE